MIHHGIINSLQTSHEHKLVLASCVTVTIHLSPPWSLGRELGLSMYKEAGGEPKKVSLTRKSKSIHADIQNKQLQCSVEESLILCGSAVGKLSQRAKSGPITND